MPHGVLVQVQSRAPSKETLCLKGLFVTGCIISSMEVRMISEFEIWRMWWL